MAILRSQPIRWATALVLLVLGATAVVGVAGGTDPLKAVRPAILGSLLLAWLIPDLRIESDRLTRRFTWCGVISGALLVVTNAVELAV